jgi:hypothetical protein
VIKVFHQKYTTHVICNGQDEDLNLPETNKCKVLGVTSILRNKTVKNKPNINIIIIIIVFENRVLRGIFGPKRDEVKREWRKLRNEELRDCTLRQ